MEKKLKLRTTNILGLNPSTQDPDSAPDDEDEEAKLASIITTTSQIGLTYEYNGQTATLKTPADIAAWVAERRKRYPTAAKAEQAKEKAEEKKRKYDEELIAKSKARRQQREEYEKKKESEAKVARWIQGGTVAVKEKEDDAAEKARLKTEKLIERAAKTQKKLVKAQNALKKAQQASASKQTPNTTFEDEEGFSGIMDGHAEYPSMQQSKSVDDLDVSSALTDDSDEATSSSGSSSEESDSESAPDVRTTKRAAPDRVLPPPRPTPPLGLALQNLCRNMMNSGVCKHGKRCKYSHVLPENLQPPAKERVEVSQVTGRPKRKGLWEIMVEKEKEEERRQVLRAVVELGDKGLLN
jgi:Nuclear fragile X mental retardation-interacting protein 1 (NUFIP1)/Zinc finger C-x8-C-x5-C-x3-H type (and similar)